MQDEEDQYQYDLTQSSSSNHKTLYEVLGVERTVTQQEIKKAYHKLALQLHPDKNPDDEEAKEKFQQLQKVISILGDEEKRAHYDQTGCVDDADLAGDFENLREFFRTMYKKVNITCSARLIQVFVIFKNLNLVTEADIEEFEANYRGSESERTDLIDLYKKCKGNMNRSKKKKESDDLYAIIAQRQNERKGRLDSMFSSLINKYGGGKSCPEPTEEEFEAAKEKLESRKTDRKSKRRKKDHT
ncbi:hypothetical protein LguiA_005467 [Lonicera macranthoides]